MFIRIENEQIWLLKSWFVFPEDLHKLYLFDKKNPVAFSKGSSVKFHFYKRRLVKVFKKIKKVFLEEKIYTVMLLQY